MSESRCARTYQRRTGRKSPTDVFLSQRGMLDALDKLEEVGPRIAMTASFSKTLYAGLSQRRMRQNGQSASDAALFQAGETGRSSWALMMKEVMEDASSKQRAVVEAAK